MSLRFLNLCIKKRSSAKMRNVDTVLATSLKPRSVIVDASVGFPETHKQVTNEMHTNYKTHQNSKRQNKTWCNLN